MSITNSILLLQVISISIITWFDAILYYKSHKPGHAGQPKNLRKQTTIITSMKVTIVKTSHYLSNSPRKSVLNILYDKGCPFSEANIT